MAAIIIIVVRRRASARIQQAIDDATAGAGTPED